MGLHFSHCSSDVCWSSGSFNHFRLRLAKQIGLGLNAKLYSDITQEEFASCNDDIIPFLNHSDCQGVLTVEELKKVAPRLQELLSDWDDNNLVLYMDKTRALLLIEGMQDAITNNESLEFQG